jgi:hypothetical protein
MDLIANAYLQTSSGSLQIEPLGMTFVRSLAADPGRAASEEARIRSGADHPRRVIIVIPRRLGIEGTAPR